MGDYGKPARDLGRVSLDWSEFMHYLYLPIKIPGQGFHVPLRLAFAIPAVEVVMQDIRDLMPPWDPDQTHIYVTARRGFASPDNPLNRPGWHADGFGTDDLNWVWSDRWGTRIAVQDFEGITDDHFESLAQFERQVDPTWVEPCPEEHVVALDPYVVHATPEVPPPGGMRSFLKISASPHPYNLLGNSHNYGLDYHWVMHDRADFRNDPTLAAADYVPDEVYDAMKRGES